MGPFTLLLLIDLTAKYICLNAGLLFVRYFYLNALQLLF